MSTPGEERPPAETTAVAGWNLLRSPEAGPRVIRGGFVRGAGYVAGVALTALASVFLLRYLGVVDFGRYVTVMSLIAIVSGVTDAGLTAVANRELATRRTDAERRRLMGNLVALRLVLTPVGVLAAVGFALVARYDETLVVGTALAGLGLVLANTQATLVLPLSADLRIGALTASEFLKQVVQTVGIGVLVLAGASLVSFFGLQIVVGLAVLAVTPLLLGRGLVWRPAYNASEARVLLVEALPIGLGLAMNVIYFRTLIIMMSLIATGRETGLFGTSFRIFEILFGLAGIVLTVAMPVLAAAAQDDPRRLRFVLQRMTEVGLLAAVYFALLLAIVAEPLLELLGGSEYRDAAPVLRIQGLALIGVFLGQAWQLGLISIRRQSALLVANGAAFAVVLAFGLVLVPLYEAVGAAVAAVVAETALAAALYTVLIRTRSELRPGFGFVWKIALAAGAASLALLVPGLPVAADAVAASVLYVLVSWALSALPPELMSALRGLRA